MHPHAFAWASLGGLVLVEAIARLAIPLYYKLIFDRVLVARDRHLLFELFAGIFAVLVVMAVAEFAQSALCASLGGRTVNELRAGLFAHVQGLASEEVAGLSAGELVGRFTSDVSAINRLVTTSIYKVSVNGAIAGLSAIALFVVEWRLAACAAAVLGLAALLPKAFGPLAVAAERARRADEARVSSEVAEALAAHRVVRAFSLGAHLRARFATTLAVAYLSARRAALLSANLDKSLGLALAFGQVLIVAVGAYLVTLGLLTAGSLIAFVGLLLNVSTSVSSLIVYVPDFVQGAGAAARINELLAQPAGPGEDAGDAQPFGVPLGIEFRNVGFNYGDTVALEDVTLAIRPGESVAFVGRSGSGKSTMVNLLLRFYDPTSGSIAFDGRDARTVAPGVLRGLIGIVFQSTFLFRASVRENIRAGSLDAPDADVEAAARAAMLHEAILELPHGYDTVVGEAGHQLSGGQQQRLALARAIVRDPAVLIVDEATSSLDPATEAAVNETLRALAPGRTCITVTHRLHTVVELDRVFVFERGRLVESGTHDELLRAAGTYAEMWAKQASFAVNASGTRARLDGLFLRTIPVFAHLDDERLELLADMFQSEFRDAGERLIQEGEIGDKLYVIVRGRVEVLGRANETWLLEDGDFFGEIALLADVPRTATVRTLDRSLLLTLHRDRFRTFLEGAPDVRAAFEAVMHERLGAAGR